MDLHALISSWRTRYQKRSPRQRIIFFAVGIPLCMLLLFFFFRCCHHAFGNPHAQNTPLLLRKHQRIIIPEHSPLRSQLQVQQVLTSNTPHLITLPGIVEGNQLGNLNILPPVTGHLINLPVTLGEEVKKEQILAEIESAAMAQAYTDTMKAKSTLKQSQEALNRAQKVNRAGANSVKDIEVLQNNYAQAQAELQRSEATLRSLGTNKENQLQIRAPMDGKITSVNYGHGSFINDATIPLFTLSNIKTIWITVCVPENLVAQVSKGQKVNIALAAYPQKTWHGQITFKNHLIDADTRCNKSRIALDNPDERLQPNMFATVKTQIPQTAQIMVPLSAILMNNDTTSVFVETSPWVFKRQDVALGSEDNGLVRITAGLHPEDRIVIAGGILVND